MPGNSRNHLTPSDPEPAQGSRFIQSLNHLEAGGSEAEIDDYLAFLKTKLFARQVPSQQIGPCNQDVPIPECNDETGPYCKIDVCKIDVCKIDVCKIDVCKTDICDVDVCDEFVPCPAEVCKIDQWARTAEQ